MKRLEGAVWRKRILVLTLGVILSLCAACDAPPPTPEPTPTLVPTPTPAPIEVLQDLRYVITWNGELLATEELRIHPVDDALVAYGDLTRAGPAPMLEQRTVQLSSFLNPLQYALERHTLGVQSTWVAQRGEDSIDCMANNQAWYAPVMVPGISPPPNLLLERAPSALPFALLALQVTEGRALTTAMAPLSMQVLDVTEPLPASRPMTVTVAMDQSEAIIGTVALQGQIQAGANPQFTMWMRPGSRVMYGVTFEQYTFGLLEQMQNPALRGTGRLVIERVSHLPELPEPARDPEVIYEAVSIAGSQADLLEGVLLRPDGPGPFPALLVQQPGGVLPPPQGLEQLVRQGWVVLTYSPAGVGNSAGRYQRAPSARLAADVRVAGEWLAQRPEVDLQRVVLVGIGEAGIVGARAIAESNPFAAAVLGSFATDMPLFPDLAEARMAALASHGGWDAVDLERYRMYSLQAWQEWLQAEREEIGLLGRRASLAPLYVWQEIDLVEMLGRAQTPVLILHGRADEWTPVDGAERLEAALRVRGVDGVEFRYLFGPLGADLGGNAQQLWDDQVDDLVDAWLRDTLGP
jgi:hypothetical protein